MPRRVHPSFPAGCPRGLGRGEEWEGAQPADSPPPAEKPAGSAVEQAMPGQVRPSGTLWGRGDAPWGSEGMLLGGGEGMLPGE